MTLRRGIAVGVVLCVGGVAAVAGPPVTPMALSYDDSAVTAQVPVGSAQTVTRPITNTGTVDVTLAAAQIVPTSGAVAWTFGGYDYGCSGMTSCLLSPNAQTDATPVFTPPDLGFYSADLTITADDGETVFLELQGTGLGTRITAPANLPLGGTPVTTTLTGTIVLDNSGNEPQDITVSFAGGDPEIQPDVLDGTVPASSSFGIPVTCTPSAVASFTTTIEIDTPGALTGDTLFVTVTCSGTDGVLRADPSVVAFGEVRVGVGATRTVMLTRVGAGTALTLDPLMFDPPTNPALTIGPPSNATVATSPATTFDIIVSADPSLSDTPLVGHIDVTATADGVTSHAPIDVTATLVTASYTTPDTLDAGSYCLGEAPRSTTTALVSTGTATILVQQPAFTSNAPHFAVTNVLPVTYPSMLAPGATAMVQVRPTSQTTAGTVTDTLQWTTDVAAQRTAQTQVSATFVADGAAISPQHVDFGSITVGFLSDYRTISLENCATSTLTLQPAVLSSTDAFLDVSAAPLPATLAPSERATIQVQFAPQKTGGAMAVLSVASSKGPLTVTLVGTGVTVDQASPAKTSFYACRTAGAPTGLGWLGVGLFAFSRRGGSSRRRSGSR